MLDAAVDFPMMRPQSDAASGRRYGSPRMGTRYALPTSMASVLPEPASRDLSPLKEGNDSDASSSMMSPPCSPRKHYCPQISPRGQQQYQPQGASDPSADPSGSPASGTWGSPVSPRSSNPAYVARQDADGPLHHPRPLAVPEGSGRSGSDQAGGSFPSGSHGSHRSPVRDLIAQFEAVSGASADAVGGASRPSAEGDEEEARQLWTSKQLHRGDEEQQLVPREESARSDRSELDLAALIISAMGAETVVSDAPEGLAGRQGEEGSFNDGKAGSHRVQLEGSRSGNRSRLAVSSSAWDGLPELQAETITAAEVTTGIYCRSPTEVAEDKAVALDFDEMRHPVMMR